MDDSHQYLAYIAFPVLVIAAILHEMAHGLAAEKLGDPTARSMGRISFNPLRHIDPFLTVILPGLLVLSGSPVIFGGAKPIPVNPGYFRNPRQGMAIVAAAGPASNVVLAGIGFLALILLGWLGAFQAMPNLAAHILAFTLIQWIIINFVLAAFNLFPLPPLDGGRIVTGLLPRKLAIPYAKIERYGLFIVFFLLYSGVINSYLTPVINFISRGILYVLSFS